MSIIILLTLLSAILGKYNILKGIVREMGDISSVDEFDPGSAIAIYQETYRNVAHVYNP